MIAGEREIEAQKAVSHPNVISLVGSDQTKLDIDSTAYDCRGQPRRQTGRPFVHSNWLCTSKQ